MPCDQDQTLSIEFKPKNKSILGQAVSSLGWTMSDVGPNEYRVSTPYGSITIKNGQAVGPATQVNTLRVTYSQTTLKVAKEWAKEKGWSVSQASLNTMTVSKGK